MNYPIVAYVIEMTTKCTSEAIAQCLNFLLAIETSFLFKWLSRGKYERRYQTW